jgi:hypothetical protein
MFTRSNVPKSFTFLDRTELCIDKFSDYLIPLKSFHLLSRYYPPNNLEYEQLIKLTTKKISESDWAKCKGDKEKD